MMQITRLATIGIFYTLAILFGLTRGNPDDLVPFAGAAFGKNCSDSVPCNPDAFLECQSNSTCGCQNPQNSEYDPKDGICKLALNKECKLNGWGGVTGMPCKEFAFCSHYSGEIKCECDMNYIESNGRCFQPFLGKCNTGNTSVPSCNTDAHFECLPNRLDIEWCDCQNHTDIDYEGETKSCVLLAGSKCSIDKGAPRCVEKAECQEKTTGGQKDYECTCADGHAADPTSRQCVAYMGQVCGHAGNATCKAEAFLECSEGKCSCDPTNTNITYDGITDKCALLPGAACSPMENYACVTYSTCNSTTKICECISPLKAGRDGLCSIPYGGSCNYNHGGRWICDQSSFLSCNTTLGMCSCDTDYEIYDEDEGVCKTMAGSYCFSNIEGSAECVKNSECDAVTEKCVCNAPDYAPSKKGICVRAFNATCNSAAVQDECNLDKGQKCSSDGHCACADPANMIYDAKTDQCYLKYNSACVPAPGDGAPCTSPLVCLQATKKCDCNGTVGQVHDGHGACVKTLGTKCGSGYPYPTMACDERAFLTCNGYYECGCNADTSLYDYNRTERRCLKNFGVTCEAANDLCNLGEFLLCKDGACACDSNHVKYGQGTQLRCVGELDAPCNSNAHCNPDESIHCDVNWGVCKTNGGERFYLNFGLAILILVPWLVKNVSV